MLFQTAPHSKTPFNADQAKELQEQWAKHVDEPLVCTNSIGMKLTLIPPGEFMMGSTEEQMRQDVEDAKGGKWYEHGEAKGKEDWGGGKGWPEAKGKGGEKKGKGWKNLRFTWKNRM